MSGQVVIIKNKNSPYYGTKCVIQYESTSGKSYYVRSLKKLPTAERFGYNKQGKVRFTFPPEKRFRVLKTSVRKTSKRAPANTNTWQTETRRLLEENSGLTRAQIKRKYT